MKTCSKCGITKIEDDFHVRKRSKDGRNSWCKSCTNINNAKNREANPDQIKNWKAEHRDEELVKGRIYYKDNKPQVLAGIKRRRQANPGPVNATNAKYRAGKRKATPPWLTKEHLRQIKLYYIVAKWVESILGENIHVDHVVPLRGKTVSGLHVPWNLQLLTEHKNCIKKNRF